MIEILLQNTTAPKNWWIEGEFFKALFKPIVTLLGEPTVGVLISGVVLMSFYVAGRGNLAAPSVLLILMAPIALGFLPAWATGVAWTVGFVGLVSGLMSLARRYVMQP